MGMRTGFINGFRYIPSVEREVENREFVSLFDLCYKIHSFGCQRRSIPDLEYDII